jgi:hypothetical protein
MNALLAEDDKDRVIIYQMALEDRVHLVTVTHNGE